jgi:hypothetical protein
MFVDKFLSLQGRKQNILGLALAKIQKGDVEIPVVATWESDRITVFAADSNVAWVVAEELIHAPLDPDPQKMDILKTENWDWSKEIDLAAAGDRAFLLYKRKFQGVDPAVVYCDVFQLDASNHLICLGSQIKVPLDGLGIQEASADLWCGFDEASSMLLIALRGVPKDDPAGPGELVVLGVDPKLDPVSGFGQAGNYRKASIDKGGYDFNILMKGGDLHCLYRQEKVPAFIPYPGLGHFPNKPISGLVYNPLCLKKFSLSGWAVTNTIPVIPGGEHPRLQCLDPLVITCDRVTDGTVTLDVSEVEIPIFNPDGGDIHNIQPPQPGAGIIIPRPVLKVIHWDVNYEFVTGFSKMLLTCIREPDLWSVDVLLDSEFLLPRAVARNGQNGALHQLLFSIDRSNNSLAVSLPLDILPIFMQGLQDDPDNKRKLIDFLYHRFEFQALARTRFAILQYPDDSDHTAPPKLHPQALGYAVIDIGHCQLGLRHLAQGAKTENGQFAPFELPCPTYQYGWVLDCTASGRKYAFDNTLGLHLAVYPGEPPITYFAYSDGDGGGRVIFAGNLPEPVAPSDPKQMDPGSVAGTGASGEAWKTVALDPAGPGFILPDYRTDNGMDLNSLGVDLEPDFDSLYHLGGPDGEGWVHLDTGAINAYPNAVQELMTVARLLRGQGGNYWPVKIKGFEYDFWKYRFKFIYDGDTLNQVWIQSVPATAAVPAAGTRLGSYRFMGAPDGTNFGQGSLDLQCDILFHSDELDPDFTDVALIYNPNSLVTIDSVDIGMVYGRTFTPGVLTSDRRSAPPPSTLGDDAIPDPLNADAGPSALSAKPVGGSTLVLAPGKVKVGVSITFLGALYTSAYSLAALLAVAGAAALGLYLVGLDELIGRLWGAGWIGIILAVVLIIGYVLIVLTAAPGIVAGYLRGKIVDHFPLARFQEHYDNNSTLSNSGEAVAEDIACRVLKDASGNFNTFAGRNRVKRQYFKEIYVTADHCNVLIRIP